MSAAKHTPEPGPWTVPHAHMQVLKNIEAGLGAWFGADRPKQRGYRSGLLGDLKRRGLIDWSMHGKAARYFVTDAGRAAIAKATGGAT